MNYENGDIIEIKDYPKSIDYECGCSYAIEKIKEKGEFSVYPNDFCKEHDPTIFHEE